MPDMDSYVATLMIISSQSITSTSVGNYLAFMGRISTLTSNKFL